MKSFDQLREGDKIYKVIFDYNTYESTVSELVVTGFKLQTNEKRIYHNSPYDLEEYDVEVMVAHFKLNNDFDLKLDINPKCSTSAYGKFTREPGQGVDSFYSTSLDKAKEYIINMLNKRLEYEIKERDKHIDKILEINKEYLKWVD